LAIIILSFVPLVITLPLFLTGKLIFSQDIHWHFVWAEQFQSALMEGVLYPRWMDTPFGYGSPTFIFYAPLSFYVISLLNILTKSTILSMNIAIYLSFFLSGLSMYFFARELNGEQAGLVSGVLYQLMPYHLFDLFARGVVPELFAFIWFPLILLFIRDIFTERKFFSIAFVSLAYAGLILTHLVSAFMFTFVVIGYGLYSSLFEKKRGLLRMLCAAALGLGLSSIYLIPVIFERRFSHTELIKIFDYRDLFLFSYKNLMKREFYPIVHGIAVSEIAFLLLSILLARRKLIRVNDTFFIALASISLFLATPLSLLVWRYMPEFSNLQFPWRWLTFSGLSVAVIAGNLIGNFTGQVRKSVSFFFSPLLIISLFIMLHLSFFQEGEIDQWRTHPGLFSPFEYRPVWLTDPGNILPPVEKVITIKGSDSFDIVDWKSNQRILSTNGKTSLMLKLSTFYYPGWIAKIDDKQSYIIIEKDTGSMLLELPEGSHKVELFFEDTSVRYYAKVISLISLVIVTFIYLFGVLRHPNKSHDRIQ
jgi:hypothetical protein